MVHGGTDRGGSAGEDRPWGVSVGRRGGGPGQNRTVDTRIFSAVLYQLSYRATEVAG